VDYCATCRGVWLDYGKLSRIVKNRERTWSPDKIRSVLSTLEGFNAPPLGEDRTLKCPECSSSLDEVNYQGTSNIIVNPCGELHGVWLDAGEIASIQIYMEHWNDYARAHADEIKEAVVEVTAQFEEAMETRFIEKGVASSRAANKLVFETLELLERWRDVDQT
jgi:Zn-finger nucleic acid-binding protein